ncbi:hypothetical protein [Bradyrhizobium sp.]
MRIAVADDAVAFGKRVRIGIAYRAGLHVAMNSMVKPDADFFLETRIA